MKQFKPWLWSFFNAVIMFAISFWWMNTNNSYGDEKLIIKLSSAIRDIIFSNKDSTDDFVFIDVSHDKVAVPSTSGNGHDIITDRRALALFLSRLNHNKPSYRFIMLDVFLEGPSQDDSKLQNALMNLPKIVGATHFIKENELGKVDLKLPLGITNYNETGNVFLKFKLIQSSSLPTFPVAMYQNLSGRRIKKGAILNFDNGQPAFKTIVVEPKISQFKVFEAHEYPVIRLSDALNFTPAELNAETVKGRIVVIGDFENDKEETIFGPTAGSLMMLNTYLCLKEKQHLIQWWWVIFMLIGFILLSKIAIYHQTPQGQRAILWLRPLLKSTAFLILLSVLSYLICSQHVQILVLTVYLNGLYFLRLLIKKPITLSHIKHSFSKFKKYLST